MYAQKLREENNGELVKTDIQHGDTVFKLELEENGGWSLQWKESLRRRQNVYGEFLDEPKK